jgi:hypothetical protein
MEIHDSNLMELLNANRQSGRRVPDDAFAIFGDNADVRRNT